MKRHHLTGKLTTLAVARAHERGTYGDGRGLYLQVASGGSRSWVLRYRSMGGPGSSAWARRIRSASPRHASARPKRGGCSSTVTTLSRPSMRHGRPPASTPPRR